MPPEGTIQRIAAGADRAVRHLLDALMTSIRPFNGRGTILFAIKAWRDFAAANGQDREGLRAGVNHLALCGGATGMDGKGTVVAGEWP